MRIPKIYFFTCPEVDNYQDDIIPLAEGLRDLGIPYYALNNYWRQSEKPDDYLFRATPDVRYTECDIVIFPYTWANWVTIDRPPVRKEFPKDLFAPGRRYKTVYFDFNDGYRTVSWEEEFRKFDVIFRCKYNSRIYHPTNMVPWALGFSHRVTHKLLPPLQAGRKKYEVLSNFGASHPYEHQLRKKMRIEFLPLLSTSLKVNSQTDDLRIPPADPYDKLMWEQTNRRHNNSYYQRLKQYLISLCFCGELISPLPFNAEAMLRPGNKGKLKRKFFETLSSLLLLQSPRIVQWDSWRFWESLVAGCVPVHINLEKAGVMLPVMPKDRNHYIAVEFNYYQNAVEFMVEEKQKMLEIAANGRQWAMDHYSPKAVAKRFLKHMDYDI
jgi:hypothetical protein